jgi:preprotein translocase subunit SecE
LQEGKTTQRSDIYGQDQKLKKQIRETRKERKKVIFSKKSSCFLKF